jgi:hypothetical protein
VALCRYRFPGRGWLIPVRRTSPANAFVIVQPRLAARALPAVASTYRWPSWGHTGRGEAARAYTARPAGKNPLGAENVQRLAICQCRAFPSYFDRIVITNGGSL